MPLGESIHSDYLMWNSEQYQLTPQNDILHSFLPLAKHYFVTMDEYDNKFRITFQRCNGFVIWSGSSGELLYMNFLHSGMSTLGLYPEELVQENLYFQWPSRTKIQCMYKRLLKEVNGDHKYLRCTYIQDNNFDLLRSEIALDKFDLECAETVKYKPTVNDSCFITYSNTFNFSFI